MNNNEGNFFDIKTIMAIILVGIVWFGWQKYLLQKYPQAKNDSAPKVSDNTQKSSDSAQMATVESDKTKELPSKEERKLETSFKKANLKPTDDKEKISETLESLDLEKVSFKISNIGMGIKDYRLKGYTDRNGENILLGQTVGQSAGQEKSYDSNYSMFQIRNLETNQPIIFTISKKQTNHYEGTAKIGGTTLVHSLMLDPDKYSFLSQILIENITEEFKGISVTLPERKTVTEGSSFLMPSFDVMEAVIGYNGKFDRLNLLDSKNPKLQTFPVVGLISIGSQYFTSALIDKSEIYPELQVEQSEKNSESDHSSSSYLAHLMYKPVSKGSGKSIMLNYIAYAGPKSLSTLQKVEPTLSESINFGFFSGIAKILLNILKWFYQFIGNWGVAIILLTLLVRFIVLPFNISSYRSMKKMQKIQPYLTAIREKNKDNPQALNMETMALMKAHKVNPVGGCLPMLLQMPVFFALYQVLGQSVELYKAPFFGWITDLSLKDPFYILPVLMGVSMWLQQKMTPSTMDPAQAKVMQFMPIVFSLMMVSLPSGLTLYIFVSTLFGIIQQMLFTMEKKTTEVVAIKQQ